MKKFFAEFRDFTMRGNAMELAIGVVIGAAFNQIVNALVNNIISPVVGLFVPAGVLAEWVIPLGREGAQIDIGSFIQAIISFLITSLVIFIIIKAVNKMNRKPEPKTEEPVVIPEDTLLLREIVNELKKQDSR